MRNFGRRELLLAGLAMGLAGCSRQPEAVQAPTPSGTAGSSAPPTASPSPSPRSTPAWTARVMTYNLLTPNLGGSHFRDAVDDDDLKLANRAPVMAKWITAAAPDIIGLQENEANPPRRLPVRALAPLLPGYRVLLPELNVPLLIRTDRYAAEKYGAVDISQGHYSRHVGWYRLRHLATGRRLLVTNTHLDPFQKRYMARARAAEMAEIVDLIGELDPRGKLPTLLLGDLNVRADETRPVWGDPLTLLAAAGLHDAARLAERDISEVPGAATLNSFGTRVGGRWTYRAIRSDGYRYDYIFVSRGTRVKTWQVVTGPGVRTRDGQPFFADGPVPSDHCPVQAEVEFPA